MHAFRQHLSHAATPECLAHAPISGVDAKESITNQS